MVYLLSVMRKYSVAVATTNREFDSSWVGRGNPKTHDEENRSSRLPLLVVQGFRRLDLARQHAGIQAAQQRQEVDEGQ
jgi:hypothetical protein